ncbi:MAG: hypothetical protein IJ840_00850 [Bacteroidales bacterium]|nr:hypothetical protein [Bacteroidales bacterium]
MKRQLVYESPSSEVVLICLEHQILDVSSDSTGTSVSDPFSSISSEEEVW